MRTKSSFSRAEEYDYVPPSSSNLPAWLEQFAADQAKAEHKKEAEPRTAVEVARERNARRQPTIYEQMSAIMSGTAPKYSSVEDAVRDYQKQTGLEEHMKRAAGDSVVSAAKQVVAAGEAACPKASRASASGGDSNESILVLDKGEDEDDEPDLVVRIPGISSFVRNMIETNHGIQLPAVQHAVIESFQRDGVGERETDDPKFCRWISRLLRNQAPPGGKENYSDLGKGVGTQREYWDLRDSNRDPFVLLVPNRGIY